MKEQYLKIILVISAYVLPVVITYDGICNNVSMTCLPATRCFLFGNMNKQDQRKWLQRYSCQYSTANINDYYGFAPIAKGDYVCCPNENVWGLENGHPMLRPEKTHNVAYNQRNFNMSPIDNQRYNIGQTNPLIPNSVNNNANENPNYVNRREDGKPPNGNHILNSAQSEPHNYNIKQYTQPNLHPNTVRPLVLNQNPTAGNNWYTQSNNVNQQPNWHSSTDQLPIFNPDSNGNNRYPNRMNSNDNTNLKAQCTSLSSFPPDPETKCCGRDYSDADRITESENQINPYLWRLVPRSYYTRPYRKTHSVVNDTVEVSIENRIAGGKTTDLNQFPWTILLKTTFNNGTHENLFNCGGSLISARYVLTAAHCIHERGSTISRIELYLAEYDKRTFPIDCVTVSGEGRRCVENIVMQPELITPHPLYDDQRLYNDIALIRLRRRAPYTEFIRPICLPTIDIDTPVFSNLPLSVAGWGRNGLYTSDVKQATVVNLVPQRECLKHYPNLSRRHLCAAGHTGEDTCKGDSGGPLMMLYQGTYFISGIVSGKRADTPCGTSVPSLYTNVFHYIQWIAYNIRN